MKYSFRIIWCILMAFSLKGSHHNPNKTNYVQLSMGSHITEIPASSKKLSYVIEQLTSYEYMKESATKCIQMRYHPYLAPYLSLFASWLTLLTHQKKQLTHDQLLQLLKKQNQLQRKNKEKTLNKSSIIPLLFFSDLFQVAALKKVFARKAAHLLQNKQILFNQIPLQFKSDIAREYYLAFQKPFSKSEKFLELSLEHLNDIPSKLPKSPTLKHLTIQNSFLNCLESESYHMPLTLVKLDLSHNKLSSLPESLSNYKNLEELILEHNDWHVITPHTLPLPSMLKKLVLAHNNIDSVDIKTFDHVRKLQKLNLNSNKLLNLNLGLKLPHLKILLVSDNKLNTLYDLGNKNIEKVDCSHNNLMQLSSIFFSTYKKLQELFLDHNPLHSLPADILSEPLNSLMLLTIDKHGFEPLAIETLENQVSALKFRE